MLRILFILSIFTLAGCSAMSEALRTNTDIPMTDEQKCVKMKRELIYNESNLNTEAHWVSKSQKNKMRRQYQEMCGKNST